MKKIVFISLLAAIAFTGYSQTKPDDSIPLYKKSTIPPFKIMQADSTWLTNAEIPKKKPVVIIYFSPECGHCQLAAQEMATNIDKLKSATFIWVSYFSVPEIKKFIENYKLQGFTNFYFGRDPQYFIPNYYKVRFTPFIAVYDKKGKFVQSFEQGTDPDTLANLINKKPT